MTLFKNSLSDVIADMKNAQGLSGKMKSLFGIVSDTDLAKINQFADGIKTATDKDELLITTMEGSSKVAKKYATQILNLNTDLHNNVITQSQYDEGVKKITKSVGQMGAKAKIATIATKALSVALNAILTVGISWGISALLEGVDSLIHNVETMRDKLDDLKGEYEDAVSKVEEVNKKIAENQKLIDEINKNPLDITNKDTLTVLENENAQLKAQYEWLKNIENQKKKELYQQTEDYLTGNNKESYVNKNTEFTDITMGAAKAALAGNFGKAIADSMNAFSNSIVNDVTFGNLGGTWESASTLGQAQELLDKLKELKKEQSGLDLSTDLGNKRNDEINKLITDYESNLTDVNSEISDLLESIDPNSSLYSNVMGLIEQFNNWFAGNASNSETNNNIIETPEVVKAKIEELTESLTTLKETYDGTFSNQSTMQSAFDKIAKGTSLTSDEVLKLKELCPELTNEFSQTADGWTIDADKIKTANANLVKSTKDDIKKQIEGYQSVIDEWNNISDYREKRSKYDEFVEAQQQIDELNLVLKMFGITLSETDEQANVTLSDLKSAFDLLKDATDEFNTNGHLTVSTLKSIVSQYPDIQESVDKFAGGLITEEQLLAELTTYYNQDLENYKTYLFDKFAATDSVTWGKYIQDNKDYIENFKEIYKIDLANCSTYADAKQKILDALVHIPDTTAYRETVKNILGNMQASYQQFYGDLNGFGSVEDILNTPDTSSKTSLPEEYQTALAKLEHEHNLELKSDKEYYIEKYQLAKDYLQGHDEYLSEWQSAEESCYKELKQLYQDAIDEQVSNYEDLFDVLKNINEEKIKALEDEKSALQDNADEQDRILKIQEAQLALDKAKKQTTWVLTEQGLKQVTDEKAVKEAQTTLDDALRESEIAELDKKIKALEDENSGYDQYKTDWENQQKKNNLVNVVGLSEDELQNITNENIKRIAEKYTDTLTAQSKLSSAETLGKTLNIDDLFKMFGSPYTADEAFAKLKEAGYSTFTNSSTDMNKLNQAVNSVTNNKNSNVGDINIVINDATDPQKVGEVVIEKLTNIYTYLNNKS